MQKRVIIIEPNYPYPYSNILIIGFTKLKNLFKTFLRKKVYKDDYGFEEVVNFIYTLNFRELEKLLLGMHKTKIASHNINDYHFKNIEYIPFKWKKYKGKTYML